MDVRQLLNTPPRTRRLPFEVLETPSPPTPISPLSTQSRPLSQLSTQSWDSRNGPRPPYKPSTALISSQNDLSLPQTPRKQRAPPTTRSDRIRIKTALDFDVSPGRIQKKYGYTISQILRAKNSRLTPQFKSRCGRKPKVNTPTRQKLEKWLLESPSRRHIAFKHMRELTPPELGLQDCGEEAIRTAFKLVGYGRRVAIRKGFSDDPEVMQERVDFAREGLTWTPDRLFHQIFSDEVWAMGGAHTQSYVTVKEDGSDRLNPECVQHKYRKLPAWMFHGTIVMGGKGPATFWEKEWGSMNSYKYDAVILNNVEAFLDANRDQGFVWMQDNASCHRSEETQNNLKIRRIPYIKWPRYSPDLNLIEHVWNWMKNWIQKHYYIAYYDASKIPLLQLKRIIWEAWEAVPIDFIMSLYSSWWKRCQAVIDAKGGPTKY